MTNAPHGQTFSKAGMLTAICALGLATALVVAGPLPGFAEETPKTPTKELGGSFFDGFERLGRHRWSISNGWANGDYQSCRWRARNLEVDQQPPGPSQDLMRKSQ
ncbi:MAG: hypothetical protein AAFO75_06110 [Pseudomonadota bacterium]